ncbi:MAG: FadD3 family acyl-CoA ligase [Deltaproteobacteria bacterium]
MNLANKTIPSLVEAAAREYGQATALEEDGLSLSFAELAGAGRNAARAFMAAGVKHGDRVAIWAPNSCRWVVAAIGAQSAGAVLVPLNTRFKGAEAGYILEKSRARLLITVEEFVGTRYLDLLTGAMTGAGSGPVPGLPELESVVLLSGQATGAGSWEDFIAGAAEVSDDEAVARAGTVGEDDLSDIMFTSGTTGKPKGAMCCHGQNIRAFESWSEVVGLKAGDRYLVVNPFFHSFGYKAGWLSSLICGATVLPHPVFDVPSVLRRVGEERISVLPGPPALYQSILAHPDVKKYDLSCLRLSVTGAAAIPVELIHRMRRELNFETIITGYGLTEVCGIATMCRYDDAPETIATTSGRAIDGVEVRCVDDQGREVPRGESGEIVIRGYNVMRGYFDDDQATADTVDSSGWLHSGDVGVMDERGYIKITDRIKDMFIVGGFNCYPAEIESLMVANQSIAQVAVIGIPDSRMGEVGMAFVVAAAGENLSPEGVVAWCRETMANYKVPRHVEIVDELPVNAAGKVMKYMLREGVAARGATTA